MRRYIIPIILLLVYVCGVSFVGTGISEQVKKKAFQQKGRAEFKRIDFAKDKIEVLSAVSHMIDLDYEYISVKKTVLDRNYKYEVSGLNIEAMEKLKDE